MRTAEDIEIPVPWGFVAGKIWKSQGLPGLALHGIFDNAGSFDRLIPLLSPMISWVCIDLPGHGKSTHFQQGQPLEFMHLVNAVKRVVDYFKWDKFYFLGHSLGAQVSVLFSAIFPECVIELVLLDGFLPLVVPEEMSSSHLRNNYKKLDRLEKSLKGKKPPSYTYEQAVEKLMNNRKLTKESAEVLVKRNLKPSGNGFMFATDQRLKLNTQPVVSLKQLQEIVKQIRCPTLLIATSDSYKNLKSTEKKIVRHDNIVKIVTNIPNLCFTLIEGNHDVHLNNAPLVAEYINNFYNIKSLL